MVTDPATPRARATPDRVLILANEIVADRERSFPESALKESGCTREVMVVAPILTTWLQSLVSDTDDARRAAEDRLSTIAAQMDRFRTAPLTQVGDENQLTAIADALVHFDADACVVVTHAPGSANYHELGVAQQIPALFRLPTTVITVDTRGQVIDFAAG